MMISNINITIDRNLCYACGECVDRCIMDNLRLSAAPCRQVCPLDMNCQGYIRLMALGKEVEAAKELRRYTPFGAILGRVCARPCEEVCQRQAMSGDGPVHIRALKRYLADTYPDIVSGPPTPPQSESGKKVAVIGSGPAGLMAAHQLRECGHGVTVFEAEDAPGGFLRHAIPAFRLPEKIVDQTVSYLYDMGIVFKTGQAVGREIGFQELEAHDAILLAVGAGAATLPALPDYPREAVVPGLDILARIRRGEAPDISGQSIIVVGGGNTAVDCALTCRMAGAREVRIVCLENPHQMPAYEQELKEAAEAGIIIENCWGVSAMEATADGRIHLSLARCLSVFDAAGRFHPELDDTCTLHELHADRIVWAVGNQVAMERLPADLFDRKTQRAAADSTTQQSIRRENVFFSGDCLNGPTSVVVAMASGKNAAVSADRFLRGQSLAYGRDAYTLNGLDTAYEVPTGKPPGGPRTEIDRLPAAERSLSGETDRTLTPEKARKEAKRCLSCGRSFEQNRTCWYCLPCEIECPTQALTVRMPYQVR